MSHEPKNYDLPHHLQHIFDSFEFSTAAKEANWTVEEFRHDVEKQLKKLTEQARKDELHAYETALTKRVLAAAKAK